MTRVVIDTNVFVSSFFGGNPRRIIDLWKTGKVILCLSRPIIEEYVDVLRRLGLQNEKELDELLSLNKNGYQLTGLETDQILKPGKQSVRVYARSLICHWAIRSLGMTAVAVLKLLGISQSAVTRAAYRGEANATAHNLELVER